MSRTSEIRTWFKGDILEGAARDRFARDASIFEVEPELVLQPKDTLDIQNLVAFVGREKSRDATLSLTPRAAGTCMSGGSLTPGIVLDTTKYFTKISAVEHSRITVDPGVYYRDMERLTQAEGLILPSYTASKDLCTVGGMVANNAGGERSLIYGNTENYIESLRVVLADGKEYTFQKLSRSELEKKKTLKSFEGDVYRNISSLIENNRTLLEAARPRVSKNSAGYLLWNVWDKENDTFDLTRLFAGSQGTLGIITSITFRLVPWNTHQALLTFTLPNLSRIPEAVSEVLKHTPESFESYDDNTYKLATQYLPEAAQQVSGSPEIALTLIAQFGAEDTNTARKKAIKAQAGLNALGIASHITETEIETESYWKIRRSSFSLLREHSGGSHRVAPFIDDFIVSPEKLPEFLPKLRNLLSKYDFTYTLAGHIGNGNFHLIPLVNMESEESREKIFPLAEEVFDLVFSFEGSMAGEHNDGIIRTPFLKKMFGKEVVTLFQKTKNIFDPLNIFNPGKKVGGTLEYAKEHFIQRNTSEHL